MASILSAYSPLRVVNINRSFMESFSRFHGMSRPTYNVNLLIILVQKRAQRSRGRCQDTVSKVSEDSDRRGYPSSRRMQEESVARYVQDSKLPPEVLSILSPWTLRDCKASPIAPVCFQLRKSAAYGVKFGLSEALEHVNERGHFLHPPDSEYLNA